MGPTLSMFPQRCAHPTVRSVNLQNSYIPKLCFLAPFLSPKNIPHLSVRLAPQPHPNSNPSKPPHRQFDMSYNSRAAGTASDFGSGGKILRPRRFASSRTPYDRPEPGPAPFNWLSTAGRVLVTGAGKLISTVIGSDTSSSGSDWGSDDEVDRQDGHLDTESLQAVFSSETKQTIEDLIMQETFSRKESDTLIQIIISRTVDTLMLTDNQDAHMNDLRDMAVVEARKWIEERKKDSGSKSHLDYGTCSLSSPLVPQITKEAGSPIDVARTYMRARPPWASPTTSLSEIRSPTSVKIHTLTGGLSFPTLDSVLSSQTKKRDYVASGSWSIADEMRKVRSRATHELLSTPSRKLELSAFSWKRESKVDIIQDGLEDNLASSSSFALAALADKGADPATEAPTSTRSTALDTTGDGMQHDTLDQMAAAPSSCDGTVGGLALPEHSNGVEGLSSANGFQGVPSMPEGVTIEDANAGSPSHEQVPDGSSQQTSNDEATLDASKKQYRVKQAVRRVRGK